MKYTEEQIDAYLLGEMPAIDREAFEGDMAHDPALAAEVALLRSMVEGLEDRQEKEEAIATWMDEGAQVVGQPAARQQWIPWVTAFSAAAAVVVAAFLFRPVFTPSSPDSPISGQPIPSVARGAADPEIDALLEKGSYQEALILLNKAIAETDSLLQESSQRLEEAEYEVQKYDYELRHYQELKQEIQERL